MKAFLPLLALLTGCAHVGEQAQVRQDVSLVKVELTVVLQTRSVLQQGEGKPQASVESQGGGSPQLTVPLEDLESSTLIYADKEANELTD